MKLQELYKKLQNKFELLIAAGCVVLLLSSFSLLVNQVRLQNQLEAAVSVSTTLLTIRWYEEETTKPTTAAPATSAALPQEETLSAAPLSGKTYVLNTNSKKIHSPDCRYAVSMKEENKETVENADLNDLLAQGYEVCSVCGGG